MAEIEEYKRVMTEIISKQAVILGPEIAVMKARSVPGVIVTDEGVVTGIEGDYDDVLHKLIDEYVELSGQIVRATLGSIFEKYPNIEHPGAPKE